MPPLDEIVKRLRIETKEKLRRRKVYIPCLVDSYANKGLAIKIGNPRRETPMGMPRYVYLLKAIAQARKNLPIYLEKEYVLY